MNKGPLTSIRVDMQLLRKFTILVLCLSFVTQSVYGQTQDCEECECGDAYSQSSSTAHWSVYIPIALLVGGAIWFGVADSSSSGSFASCSDSGSCSSGSGGNGLGSMASSSRSCRSSSRSSKFCPSYSSSFRSTQAQGHHFHSQ